MQDPLCNNFEAQKRTCAYALTCYESSRETCKTDGRMQSDLRPSFSIDYEIIV